MRKLLSMVATLLVASGSLFAVSGTWVGVGANLFEVDAFKVKYEGYSAVDYTTISMYSRGQVHGATYFGDTGQFGVVYKLYLEEPYQHSNIDGSKRTDMTFASGAMFSYKVFQKQKLSLDLNAGLDTELEYADDSSDTETSFQLRLSASAMFMYDLAEHVALRAGFDMGVLLGEWGDEDLAYKHGLLVSTPLLLVYRF